MPVDWLILTAALVSGLTGGLHCAAMCGGIATGFSSLSQSSTPWATALQANLGRIGGYTLAGAIVGGVGHGLLSVLRLPWLGFTLRLLVGLALIVLALRLMGWGRWFNTLPSPGTHLWVHLRPLQSRLLRIKLESARCRLASGQRAQWRADHARLRPWYLAGNVALDLVRAAHGRHLAAPAAATCCRICGLGHGAYDHRRAVADAASSLA